MTELDFEQRLRAGLRGAVDAVAPPALRAAVNAIPQAMGTVERREWTAGWGFPRMNRFAVGVAAAAVITLAIGISLLLRPPNVGPSPVPVVPTATPASPSPSAAGLPAQPGQFADVTDFGLASTTVGWVSTPSALYRTENFGHTWSAVTPPGWPTASFSGVGRMTSIFIDADTAYTFLPGLPGTIAVTHDGGATWDETALAGTTPDSQPVFGCPTTTSGSLIFWGALKTDPSRVFDTADGGSTWTGPHAGPSENKWGASGAVGLGCLQVRTLTPPGDVTVASRLQVSHDAGATWIDRTLPVGPQAPASTPSNLVDKEVIAAWADAGGRIVMALHVWFSAGIFDQIYTSLDDGRSWEYLQTQDPLHIGGSSQFLSATEWILVAHDASTFMSTLDGGATWRTTVGSPPFVIGSTSFGSPDLGWAVPSCDFFQPDNSPLCDQGLRFTGLLQTTDGGQTWTQLGK